MPPPETRPETWRAIKPGDNIILKDLVTIEARMAEGKGPTPETYQVSFRMSIKNKLAEWILYCLNEKDGLFLIAKLVDKTVAFSVLKEKDDWEPSVRSEIIGTDNDFLFSPPENPDEIDPEKGYIGDPNTLHYAPAIEIGASPHIQKPQGEQSGSVSFNPLQSGTANHVATVVEYATGIEGPESELVFVESGEPQHGVIKMLLGRTLKVNDVKIMR